MAFIQRALLAAIAVTGHSALRVAGVRLAARIMAPKVLQGSGGVPLSAASSARLARCLGLMDSCGMHRFSRRMLLPSLLLLAASVALCLLPAPSLRQVVGPLVLLTSLALTALTTTLWLAQPERDRLEQEAR